VSLNINWQKKFGFCNRWRSVLLDDTVEAKFSDFRQQFPQNLDAAQNYENFAP
jgi:hypothetical protein